MADVNPGTTNLVSWWTLNETSGTRYDSHGTNHLTDGNTVSYAAGKKGNAADIEEANNESLYHDDNADLSFGTGVYGTIGFWIKPETVTGLRNIIAKRGGSAPNEYFVRFENNSKLTWTVGSVASNGSTLTTVQADTFGVLSVGTWYFVAVKYDGSKIYIRINNSEDSVSYSSDIYDYTRIFTVGMLTAGYSVEKYDGLIDELFFYKRALSSDEISWLYNAGAGRTYSDLLGPPKVKTINGTAIESAKTINGVPTGNVKSVLGLS